MIFLLGKALPKVSTSYIEKYQFIDNQEEFNLDSGNNLSYFTLFSVGKLAKDLTTHTLQRITTYVIFCEVFIFCAIVENQEVGTRDCGSRTMLIDVELAFFKVRLDFSSKNKGINFTSDDLFKWYMEYTSLLSTEVDQRGLNLLFFNIFMSFM